MLSVRWRFKLCYEHSCQKPYDNKWHDESYHESNFMTFSCSDFFFDMVK